MNLLVTKRFVRKAGPRPPTYYNAQGLSQERSTADALTTPLRFPWGLPIAWPVRFAWLDACEHDVDCRLLLTRPAAAPRLIVRSLWVVLDSFQDFTMIGIETR
jgi:hypothetical protein